LNQQKEQSDALKNKMAEALKGFSSNDLSVIQKNGKVYVSLSENLLFPSGSAVVNKKGVDALSKLAAVLNLNNDVAINIEGHTDSIPIKGRYKDNWDLSTARANAIVRILVDNYKVDPLRVMASGHSRYDPVDTNSTPEGRSKNRRTEIILSPKLDEMYKLLES
jgi:chemotaxis protein MotB